MSKSKKELDKSIKGLKDLQKSISDGAKKGYNKRLKEFKKSIEDGGFRIKCSWTDEYGGIQGIILEGSDKLEII